MGGLSFSNGAIKPKVLECLLKNSGSSNGSSSNYADGQDIETNEYYTYYANVRLDGCLGTNVSADLFPLTDVEIQNTEDNNVSIQTVIDIDQNEILATLGYKEVRSEEDLLLLQAQNPIEGNTLIVEPGYISIKVNVLPDTKNGCSFIIDKGLPTERVYLSLECFDVDKVINKLNSQNLNIGQQFSITALYGTFLEIDVQYRAKHIVVSPAAAAQIVSSQFVIGSDSVTNEVKVMQVNTMSYGPNQFVDITDQFPNDFDFDILNEGHSQIIDSGYYTLNSQTDPKDIIKVDRWFIVQSGFVYVQSDVIPLDDLSNTIDISIYTDINI